MMIGLIVVIIMIIMGEVFPFREAQLPRVRRWVVNLGSAGIGALLAFVLWSAAEAFVLGNEAGLQCLTRMEPALGKWGRLLVLLLAYDFSLWVWHAALHRFAWLWRFHRFHHLDAEMDATTGLRFHPGEIALSGIWRLGLLALLGPSAIEWVQVTFAASVMAWFHHGRLKLPLFMERMLELVFVTPNWHRRHHHILRRYHDAHYGVVFSFWDRLFHTWHQQLPSKFGLEGEPPAKSWDWREMFKIF
jgi:sterol desaturase/sphingolipid hydroxylase (fatty acid hydroxylase superfamily)